MQTPDSELPGPVPAGAARPSARDVEPWVADAVDGDGLTRERAEVLGRALDQEAIRDVLCEGARARKLAETGDRVTFSRNLFIPLTNLCRNRCSYCSFAKQPDAAEAHTYSLEEVEAIVRGGVATGCIEALLCLGDKPEIAYRSYREMLSARGLSSTTDLLVEACRIVVANGMLPHTNAGILTRQEMALLRPYNASMGLMLETTSRRLREKGMAHFHAPDKEPARRIRMHEEAGELKIPFTSGILLGIGENEAERVETLFTIRELALRYGHIQEAIIQPFHAKPSTKMSAVSGLADDEVIGWVALARLILPRGVHCQAPPNLGSGILPRLLSAGVDDWGGVSPITVDFINPEAPWPALRQLREETEKAGFALYERGPVYPDWIRERPDFFDPQVRALLPKYANDEGYAQRRNNQSDEEAA
ncbi:MAG: 7,8-didemethyl-8-hydroxy-5-deazariboflavin synthase CofG [Deltaproteobacteria bacterium]|nr:7,8-didemethyl-8-hydroxy-5-deazariboflavin synthase CofG [Deltaproteobacteria bacterium]